MNICVSGTDKRDVDLALKIFNQNLFQMRIYSEKVVGVDYYPHTTPKETELITFKREPTNLHDRNAIEAFNEAGEKIGHLNKYAAAKFAKDLDRGLIYICAEFDKHATYTTMHSHCYNVRFYITFY